MKIFKTVAIVAFSFFSMAAQATVITFDDQIVEAKPNGYTVSGVTFVDTIGEDLVVTDQGGGNHALAVLIDDESFFGMIFPSISNSLSLMFGNDNPQFSKAGDIALLMLYLDGEKVGQTSLALNRNNLMDQTISLAGINFDVALFGYANSNGFPIALTELVDNITFTEAGTIPAPIPEPASLALLGLGLLGMALSRHKIAPRALE
jgi:hypothetical protein